MERGKTPAAWDEYKTIAQPLRKLGGSFFFQVQQPRSRLAKAAGESFS
jgi:hypothetical protein